MLPMPGVWHFLFHATKDLVGRYYFVGLESVCKILDADDKHMLAGNNYWRNHHFLVVMFEALWLSVVEIYL